MTVSVEHEMWVRALFLGRLTFKIWQMLLGSKEKTKEQGSVREIAKKRGGWAFRFKAFLWLVQ